jgi:aryl-alcohol dehydrogenase-like predicted oxidoreductase
MATDRGYADAIRRALELGCNVFDTAVAYRDQRSERVVGETLELLIGEGQIRRNEVVVSSKAGFIPFDSDYSGELEQYNFETFLSPGIFQSEEVVAPGHCLSPRFIEHQIGSSRANLRCESIDIYYLHNPETQLRVVSRDELLRRLRRAFEQLEAAVTRGQISLYGVSSWQGFRVAVDDISYLSIDDLLQAAEDVAGQGHRFRAVMIPLNLSRTEAFNFYNQHTRGRAEAVSLVQAAKEKGVMVFAGSALNLGRLTDGLPRQVRAILNGELSTDAQRSLQFARSVPGIMAAVVATANPRHVEENLAIAKIPPLSEEQFQALFH